MKLSLIVMRALRTLRFEYLHSAIRIVAMVLLISQASNACSWDYPIWQIRRKSSDPLYRFVQNEKAGYIDRFGKVIIKPTFDAYGNHGGEFQGGLLHIGLNEAQYVDTTGKLVIDKNYSSAWDFSEGLAAALPENGNRWGYIDRTGEFVISPRFDGHPNGYVYSFSDGLAMIEVGRKYGYIDRSGEFVIQPKFLDGAGFHEGRARVVVEGPCRSYDGGPCMNSRAVGEVTEGELSPCKFTFIDKSGSIITAERYDDAKEFSEGLAPVRVGKKWGYIDKKGRMVIKPKFDEAEPFSDGLARVQQGELYGYINRAGAFVISPQYERAQDFSEGLAVVSSRNIDKDDDEFYYIDKRGRQAIAGKYIQASPFFKGLAHVKLEIDGDDDFYLRGTFAYIDASGRKVFVYKNGRQD